MSSGYTRFTLVLGALALTACSGLLDVNSPDVINPKDLQNADGAIAAYNGAIGDFTFANDGDNGGTEGQILVSGVFTDEYIDVETFPTRIEYDSRSINENNGTLTTVYFNLHKARIASEGAASALQQYADTAHSKIAEMLSLAGFTYVYFAENYCSGVPFSERQPDGSIAYGTPQSTNQILAIAISRFDSALGMTTDPNIVRLARVGKGRALQDSGNFAGANAAVAAVGPGVYQTGHSTATNRQWNGVFVFNNQAPAGTARFSVSDVEGTNGLPFRSAADPRVPTVLNGKGFDNSSPLYVLKKYTGPTSPVTVAGYVEARLIRAEAALHGTPSSAVIDTLNAIRADSVNNGGFKLAVLADPGSDTARATLLFRERAFWLFATGHRLGDLRRLARAPYSRAVNATYPVGAYPKGTVYGSNTELPVPFDERNNPNFTGCNATVP
jgi:hypothetical protein